jgi:HSP20 family molecular chaperone IbpA
MTPQPAVAAQRAALVQFHNICRSDQLLRRMQAVNEGIAKRARELAQARGEQQGYLEQDWLQARAEYLRPVEYQIENFADRIRVRATVLGFEEDELQVSIEPARIIIAGKKEQQPEFGNRLFYVDWSPDEILQIVNLPEDVDPAVAVVTLRAGVLEFTLLKSRETPDWATGVMDG